MMGPPLAAASSAAASVWNEGIKGDKGAVAMWKMHAVLALTQCSYSGSIILSKVAFTAGLNPAVFMVFRDIVGVACVSPVAFFFERYA